MKATTRPLLVSAACALFALVALASVFPASHERGRGTGLEWLSWTSSERNAFMNGYVTGYLRGTSKACNGADDLFEVNKPHTMSDRPSERCLGRVDLYSRDADAYAAVLTAFYSDHPEYRGIPSAYLLSFLSDTQFRSADELYQMSLTGKIRTNF